MKRVLLIIFLSVLIILAWSPWISKEYAKEKAIKNFEEAQKISMCDLLCPKVTLMGVKTIDKIPFGYLAELEYKEEIYDRTSTSSRKYFVSFFGKVHDYQTWWNQLLTNLKGSQIQVI